MSGTGAGGGAAFTFSVTEAEKVFNSFLKKLKNVDKKLSVSVQKTILRNAVKGANSDLKARVAAEYSGARTRAHDKKGNAHARLLTGDAVKSVKLKVGTFRTDRRTAYLTYGFRNKGIPDRYYWAAVGGVRKTNRIRPKPAQYVGIWNEYGTVHIGGTALFRRAFAEKQGGIVRQLQRDLVTLINRSILFSN